MSEKNTGLFSLLATKKASCVSALLILASGLALAQEIDWYSIDGGGGISSATDIQLIGVIGQMDTGRMSGGNISLSGGYLPLPPDLEMILKDGFEQ